jgi:RNA polymerase sigma factor (sigma-70 family)
LFEKLQYWAYHFLLRNNFHPKADTFELAVSYASDAGVTLIHTDYSYDVPSFEAWTVELVKNVCRKNIRKAVAQRQIPEAKLSPLDEYYSDSDIQRVIEEYIEQEHDLNLGMAELTERERFVIVGIFNGLETDEIAAHLGTSHSHVYKLKSQAIQKIRGKISGE